MSDTENNNNTKDSDKEQKPKTDDHENDIDFHEAAVIDEHGNAVPITEEMVQEACAELERSRDLKPEE